MQRAVWLQLVLHLPAAGSAVLRYLSCKALVTALQFHNDQPWHILSRRIHRQTFCSTHQHSHDCGNGPYRMTSCIARVIMAFQSYKLKAEQQPFWQFNEHCGTAACCTHVKPCHNNQTTVHLFQTEQGWCAL